MSLTPAEARGLLRVARHDGGQPVSVGRPSLHEMLEVTVSRPIVGATVLWLDVAGEPHRLIDALERAQREASGRPVLRGNLAPLDDGDLDPLTDWQDAPTSAVP